MPIDLQSTAFDRSATTFLFIFGVVRFERTTFCTQNRCTNPLCNTPIPPKYLLNKFIFFNLNSDSTTGSPTITLLRLHHGYESVRRAAILKRF